MGDAGGQEPPFGGTQRFSIVRRLGSGGMGVVYQARDHEREADVALKVLREVDAAGIYRFKQEFRALADVTHPSLVALYELVSSGQQWFLTMELVDGVDFLSYVRGIAAAPAPDSDAETVTVGGDGTQTTANSSRPKTARSARHTRAPHPPVTGEQVERLRSGLIGLVDGVRALHLAGHLHRDLKPSNVLVREGGHVTVLDFGVVTALARQNTQDMTGNVVGTPSYMAPEQAAGKPLTPASDWYAVGVMIYEALTGTQPFRGDVREVLERKKEDTPPPVVDVAADAPADLVRLCADLLARDPAARPDSDEILRRLGALDGSRARRPVFDEADLIIGRDRELATLEEALARARSGAPTIALVHGRSGIGKSTLLRHFTRALASAGDTVVLSGRCYERESVPYKAIDSMVDALTRFLLQLDADELWRLLPDNVSALARLFPVLRQIEAVRTTAALEPPRDPRDERRGAFSALRCLLAELSKYGTVVIAIDDLQWGDLDSAALLEDLLEPPDAPPVLLVASFRRQDRETSPFLARFLAAHADAIAIPVEPLALERAEELAESLLRGDSTRTDGGVAAAIARESAGNPLFVGALVRHVRDAGLLEPVSLDDLLRTSIGELPAPARRLLEYVAVAGRPVAQGVVRRAADLREDGRNAFAALRSARLTLTHGGRDVDSIEAAHDRVREAVVAQMSEDSARECHLNLARALESSPPADAESLADHFLRGGRPDRAAHYCEEAGDGALRALAFDRAAALFERAIRLSPDTRGRDAALWGRLGDALSHAGHPFDAAGAYSTAAQRAGVAGAFDYRRRAAEKWLHSGDIVRGMEQLREVVAHVGIDASGSPRRLLTRLVWRRARLRLRGLGFEARPASQIHALDLMRLDVCWSASIGLGMLETVRAADFQTRHLLLALRAGEADHLARGLSAEACYRALGGPRAAARAERIARRAHVVAGEGDDPSSTGFAWGGSAMVAYMSGRWREAYEACNRAEPMFRRAEAGISWELAAIQVWRIWSLYYLGEMREMSVRVLALLRDAEQRGDRFTVANLSTGEPSFIWLALDQPGVARDRAEHALDQWSVGDGFHFQHYWREFALMQADLYDGAGEAALERAEAVHPHLERTLMLRVRLVHTQMTMMRAHAALHAAAENVPRRDHYLGMALRWARRLAREPYLGCRGQADLCLAAVARARGDDERAARRLRAAEDTFRGHDMSLLAWVARRNLGLLLGGDEGDAAIAAADTALTDLGVRNPARMARMYQPG